MDGRGAGNLLRALGLTRSEAASLLCLLETGVGLTAEQVSRETGLPLSTAYRALNSLHAKGMVDVTPGRPMIFRSKPAADVISSALSLAMETAMEAAAGLANLLPSSADPPHVEFEVSTGAWLVPLRGVRALEAAASALIRSASERLVLCPGDPRPPFWSRILRLAESRRGIELDLTVELSGGIGGACSSSPRAAVTWEQDESAGWVGIYTSLEGLTEAICGRISGG